LSPPPSGNLLAPLGGRRFAVSLAAAATVAADAGSRNILSNGAFIDAPASVPKPLAKYDNGYYT
jgi:hypothetical protein